MKSIIILDRDTAQVYYVIRTTADVEKLQKILDDHTSRNEGCWTVEGVFDAFHASGISFEVTKFDMLFV
jgi:hypothetical protein